MIIEIDPGQASEDVLDQVAGTTEEWDLSRFRDDPRHEVYSWLESQDLVESVEVDPFEGL